MDDIESEKRGDACRSAAATGGCILAERQEAAKKKEEDKKISSPFVFPSRGKSGHIRDIKRGWKKLKKNAKLANLTVHDLRRTLGVMDGDVGSLASNHRRSSGAQVACSHKGLCATSDQRGTRCDDAGGHTLPSAKGVTGAVNR
jgi:integrase